MQYEQCCDIKRNQGFRFPDEENIHEINLISETVLLPHKNQDSQEFTSPMSTPTTERASLMRKDIFSSIDSLDFSTKVERSATLPGKTSWILKVTIQKNSKLKIKLSARDSVAFLAKFGEQPLLRDFDILTYLNGASMMPYSVNLLPGEWFLKLKNEEKSDQEMLLSLSLEVSNANENSICCSDTCKIVFDSMTCERNEKHCLHGDLFFSEGCRCHKGWFGDHCNISSSDCSSNVCKNHGICIHQEEKMGYQRVGCDCDDGYYGSNCELEICVNECGKNGICQVIVFEFLRILYLSFILLREMIEK